MLAHSAAKTTSATTRSTPSSRRCKWRSDSRSSQQPLPVFKVLYRNSSQLQARDLHHTDTLHAIAPTANVSAKQEGLIRDAVRACDWAGR